MRGFIVASILGCCVGSAEQPQAREWTSSDGTVVKYRWSAPQFTKPGKTYPLILFLHGSGECGDDNALQLQNGVIPLLEGTSKLGQPVFLIAPQCPSGRDWSPIDDDTGHLTEADQPNPLLDSILELADTLSKMYPIDPKRFYVTGLSMGGFSTWDVLGRVPERIAAAVPICGGGDPALVDRFVDVPIWAFHGTDDSAVPVGLTREMIAALKKAGGSPKVTYYPGVDHDSWTRTYDDPEMLRWMLNQHRD